MEEIGLRHTGYKDKNGKIIREGDLVEGAFTAPWDHDVWITRRFRVVKEDGRWLCDGVEASDENDWLSNFEHLTIVNEAEA